jgi:hypothetical protein
MDGSRQARTPHGCTSFGDLPEPQMLVHELQAMLLSRLEPNEEPTP